MKINRKILRLIFGFFIIIIFASCNEILVKNRLLLGPEVLKQELATFLNDSSRNFLRGEILIKDEKTLISIAEPILFNIYGQENIEKQRPYEAYLFGDNWIISGTLPKGTDGGVFIFSINRKTCKVVGISHGK